MRKGPMVNTTLTEIYIFIFYSYTYTAKIVNRNKQSLKELSVEIDLSENCFMYRICLLCK
jgi:hypothetical protein